MHRIWDEAIRLSASAGVTRPVLLAAVAALALALGGRALRNGALQAMAPAFGMILGWAGVSAGAAATLRFAPERLPFLPIAALLAALAAVLVPRARRPAAALLFAFAVWWLAGAPHGPGGLLADLPALLLVALLAAGLWRGIAQPPWVAVVQALALWLDLLLAGVAAPWTTIALVPLAACAGLLTGARGVAPVLALQTGILAAAAAALLGAGGAARARPGFADCAVLAPIAVAWAAPYLGTLRWRAKPRPPPAKPARKPRKPRKT